MSAIRGKYVDGAVILDAPANWPEGMEVRVSPAEEYVGIGMREEDWPTTTEGIAAWIESIDKLEPFLTLEEDEEWQKARAEQKVWELANWEKRNQKIDEMFR